MHPKPTIYTPDTMTEAHHPPNHDLSSLPLFPLNTVLFPGMALPLHIFEERYKAMIGDCIEQEQPFGVVLIKSGKEAGGPAEPFSIGTTARVVNVEQLEEGRMNILTAGERRFETEEVTQRTPHLEGRIRYLEEEPGEPSDETMAEFREEFGAYLKNLSSLAGGWTSQAPMPQDLVTLSYSAASSLDVPLHVRQTLLESPTAGRRLERLLPMLKRGNKVLEQAVAKRNPFQGPRLN